MALLRYFKTAFLRWWRQGPTLAEFARERLPDERESSVNWKVKSSRMDGIGHFKIRWWENISDNTFPGALAGKVIKEGDGKYSLILKVRAFNQEKNKEVVLFFSNSVDPFNPQWSGPREKPTAWGMERLGPGVWSLEPSLIISGLLHAFITLVEVPEPAPW